jgi:hypothetical protein
MQAARRIQMAHRPVISVFEFARAADAAPSGGAQAVEDRHFHPVEPRTLRLTVETRF